MRGLFYLGKYMARPTKKDDLPAMMFYVGDWLKAPDIQCLDYETKGIWFEMLCYMWESNERGYLKYNDEQLARLLRLPEVLLKQKLKQLLDFAIYSIRESDGAIYSRRMVKDQEIREMRKKAGSLGGKQTFARAKARAKVQQNTEDEYEVEDEVEYEVKKKKVMPEFYEFLEYAKTIKIYQHSMEFQLEAKYNSWVSNGWKDGNGNKIIVWKTKLQNAMVYFKKDDKKKIEPEYEVSDIMKMVLSK